MKGLKEKSIPYEVVRSQRATADIIIERDGSVLVRAPVEMGDEQINDIVISKYYWMYKSLAEWRDLNATRELREYKNGEGFLYLGCAYRLLLVHNQKEPLKLKDGRFCLRRDIVEQDGISRGTKFCAPTVKKTFRDYYTKRGIERINQRVSYYAPKVGVIPKAVNVREIGHRWATCSPSGKLAFHWKCMMAPQTIIDYIVVHELCHFHHRDHTGVFWNEVDKVMPKYRERKEWLRKNGAGLDV